MPLIRKQRKTRRMIYRNPIDLKSALKLFVNSSHRLIIFAPFIKIGTIRELLLDNHVESIITRWQPKDLIEGSSDIELYGFCEGAGITLFRNPKLHLKAFISDYQRAFIGSMNISERAISEDPIFFNYEIGTIVEELTLQDRIYFKQIINESEIVTHAKYLAIKEQVHLFKKDVKIYPEDFDFSKIQSSRCKRGEKPEYFLISNLPMSLSSRTFAEIYFGIKKGDKIEEECYIHDLISYSIPFGLSEIELKDKLKHSFFSHPFISAFISYLESRKSLGFTEVSIWFQDHTTTVPIPRRWEISENTRILYDWICELSDGKYKWDCPSHRQRIYCHSYYKNHILPLYIDKILNLRVDKAHGFEAINKPVLLAAVIDAFEIGVLNGRIELNDFVLKRFKEYYTQYSHASDYPNAVIPFFHIQNDGLWEIKYKNVNSE